MPATAYDLEDMDPFFRDLGDLQAKFMSLEHDLRTFLFLHSGRPFMQDMESVAVGDSFEANEFTNYDTLGQLIDKYNDVVRPKNAALVIHRGVIDVRDDLAHGRLFRRFADRQSRLLKFSKPDKATGMVRAETLDPATLLRWNTFYVQGVPPGLGGPSGPLTYQRDLLLCRPLVQHRDHLVVGLGRAEPVNDNETAVVRV